MPDSSLKATSTGLGLVTNLSVPPASCGEPSIAAAFPPESASTGDGVLAVSSSSTEDLKTRKFATVRRLYKASVSCATAFDSLLQSSGRQSDPLFPDDGPAIEFLKRLREFQSLSQPDIGGLNSALWMAKDPHMDSGQAWPARSTAPTFDRFRSTIDSFGRLQGYMSERSWAETEYTARVQDKKTEWDGMKKALDEMHQHYSNDPDTKEDGSVFKRLNYYTTGLEKSLKRSQAKLDKHRADYCLRTQELNRCINDLLSSAHDISQELSPELPDEVTLESASWLYKAHTLFQSIEKEMEESDLAQEVLGIRRDYRAALTKKRSKIPTDGDEEINEEFEAARRDLLQHWFGLVASERMLSASQAEQATRSGTSARTKTIPMRVTRSTTRNEREDRDGPPSKRPRK